MLDRAELLRLLGRLSARLEDEGLHGDLFVVGGAAMALAYNSRRSTRDVDAVFEPKIAIYRAAAAIAAEEPNLPADWLNDAVKGLLPGPDPGATVLFDRPGLTLRVASPRYLFALKIAAARVERDTDDIVELATICEVRTVDDALSIVIDAFGDQPLVPKAQYLLEELFGESSP